MLFRSVGEVMSIGRTFQQALHKALRSMEQGNDGLNSPLGRDIGPWVYTADEREKIKLEAKTPTPRRLFWLAEGLRAGMSVDDLYLLSAVDPWFLREY